MAAVCISTSATAQVIAGTVRDSTSLQPLRGAVVQLLDRAGRPIAQTITHEGGTYRVHGSPAVHRIRVVRLGFRPRELRADAAAAASPIDVAMVSIPMLLEQVHVTAGPSKCSRRPDRAAAMSLLGQIEGGLLNSVIGRTAAPATMTRLHYRRRLGARGEIREQQVRKEVARSTQRSFGAARNAAAFVADGFVDARTNTFFAPDAETLVDTTFTNGYCFHIAPPHAQMPHLVGLGIKAAESKAGRIDIDGVLWVDSAARSLHALDFRYVGLPVEVMAEKPGGRISFREMDNGVIIIDAWFMRLISGEYGGTRSGITRTGRVVGPIASQLYAEEIGGAVAGASWADGTDWRAALGSARIRTTTVRGEPAPGVVVDLQRSNYRGTSDSLGIVHIEDLLPGPYTAVIVDPVLADLGLSVPTTLQFVAERTVMTDAELQVTTAWEFVRGRCSASEPDLRGAWLLGRITDQSGRPIDGARWTVRSSSGLALVEGGRVGGDGLFHTCQLEPGARLEVSAVHRNRTGTVVKVLRDRITTVSVTLQ